MPNHIVHQLRAFSRARAQRHGVRLRQAFAPACSFPFSRPRCTLFRPPVPPGDPNQEAVWPSAADTSTTVPAFERTSKRRKGYPSETSVKRGIRVLHGDKELLEKLGRKDLCPCGSGRRFQALLSPQR